MDFARKILGKYGWKDGDGLGKNNTGIAKPLRATLKFDNAGFGTNAATADFNNHWWERVFNDAAKNVDVKNDGDKIRMDLKDNEDGVEISTKGYSLKKLKKAKASKELVGDISQSTYDNFLQAATLTNLGGEVENPNRIDISDIEVSQVKVLSDEELFKACGGRTAHKGARHGLKLSGKLARLEQQEKELLAKMMAKQNGAERKGENETQENKIDNQEKLKKKKKRKHAVCEGTIECTNTNLDSEEIIPQLVEEDIKENDCEFQENIKTKKNKKSKRKRECVEIEEKPTTLVTEDDAPKTEKKKKSKKAKKSIEGTNSLEETVRKKKKDKKSKYSEE